LASIFLGRKRKVWEGHEKGEKNPKRKTPKRTWEISFAEKAPGRGARTSIFCPSIDKKRKGKKGTRKKGFFRRE